MDDDGASAVVESDQGSAVPSKAAGPKAWTCSAATLDGAPSAPLGDMGESERRMRAWRRARCQGSEALGTAAHASPQVALRSTA